MSAMSPTLSMYEASVPVFARYLNQLSAMLDLAQKHARKQGLDANTLLQARLSPTMYPFIKQVEIAAGFALRACAPLAGLDKPADPTHIDGFDSLQKRIQQVLAFLESITPERMAGSEDREFTSQAGLEPVSLRGPVFLTQYALPNFFFHVTTAYAILRHMGVGIGKSDYDGFHTYA
ncbi:DUF1993 domain-containing protein [Albitalea terrae]|uniref:DUF1993 domain-containing protein n=2 Tax=Piscinibacter terrae TaxID=2496871 RepID=A0A3N7HRP3_9BURK|nr:DUF1993 domain-containing protein [Albitalea terrae]